MVIVGALTLLVGAIIGCAKDDIKQVLAWSTMSQIGYMLLGRRARPAGYAFAIIHLLAHGFFKAGLFLGAGSVMHGMNDEVDMRRFGGAARSTCRSPASRSPVGCLAIIGIPPFVRLLHQGPDHRGRVRRAADTAGSRPGRAARRRPHRVLHDPAVRA